MKFKASTRQPDDRVRFLGEILKLVFRLHVLATAVLRKERKAVNPEVKW